MSIHWAALLTKLPTDTLPAIDVAALALWALQFTPRVACLEEAVVLEVGQSMRLFGYQKCLHQQVSSGAAEFGALFTAWAPTSLAALALARAGVTDGFARPLNQLLDPLPFRCLSAVHSQAATLARLGCRTLADVRQLPRGGVSRRFSPQLLTSLDQAYGLAPEVHVWVTSPVNFMSRLELPGRVETCAGLLFGARRLLTQLNGWLLARNAGVAEFVLRWHHDSLRSREAGEGGSVTVRLAEPTQNVEHLFRLLAENLVHKQLLAPALELELGAIDVVAMPNKNHSLLPGPAYKNEALDQALERVQARLGKKRVLRPSLVADHRLEWMQRWQTVSEAPTNTVTKPAQTPQPTWILRTPLKLSLHNDRPIYHGLLLLLLGPDRVEGGWWHRAECEKNQSCNHGSANGGSLKNLNVQRDYWVAISAHAGVLWIFQQRLERDETAWYLHGYFS